MESGSDAVVKDLRSAVESVSAEDDFSATPLHEIESLCMRCGENGITRMLLTRIPHFREIVLMAFECPHCNERNNEIQFAGQLQPRGCCYQLKVPSGDAELFNRQVVKSDSATIRIPELDFEIPPEAQRGKLSTVEGILLRAADELQALQDERKKVDPGTAEALDQFLLKLRSFAAGISSFTFILDDPAGNSFVENPSAPSMDPLLSIHFYERTREQQASLGFLVEPPSGEEASAEENNLGANGMQNVPHGSVGAVAGRRAIAQANTDQVAAALCRYSAPEEVDTLPSSCWACAAACVTRFYATNIPYFREVIVMATACDLCGYRSSELKAGGEIPKKGKKITVSVQSIEDLSRDVIKDSKIIPDVLYSTLTDQTKFQKMNKMTASLTAKNCKDFLLLPQTVRLVTGSPRALNEAVILAKNFKLSVLNCCTFRSDTASVRVPEADLELSSGTLGGMVTTIEGLITKMSESLERVHGFQLGGSIDEWKKKKWQDFKSRLLKLLELEEPWTLILDDAMASSFVSPITDVIEDDKQLVVEEHERSWEQNEELGLNDMDTFSADNAYNTA